MILHATLLVARRRGRWCGVLLRGPSGAGKSDLALRLLERGWRLVADDRVRVWTSGGGLYGRAPSTLAGLIEVRGVGVVTLPVLAFARIVLAVDAGAPEHRLPPPDDRESLLGLALPRLRLALLEPSAPARLDAALHTALASPL